VYIDEVGVDERLHRPYGYAEKGRRVFGDISGKRGNRISIIGAYSQRRLMAPFHFEGHTNTDVFNDWLENILVPELTTGQVVIMDNVSFHKSSTTRSIIEKAGCSLMYLPTYSPDLNPIEKQWANLKNFIRSSISLGKSLLELVEAFFTKNYQYLFT
jgi:transposase